MKGRTKANEFVKMPIADIHCHDGMDICLKCRLVP